MHEKECAQLRTSTYTSPSPVCVEEEERGVGLFGGQVPAGACSQGVPGRGGLR